MGVVGYGKVFCEILRTFQSQKKEPSFEGLGSDVMKCVWAPGKRYYFSQN
jgi:hypothetical protein